MAAWIKVEAILLTVAFLQIVTRIFQISEAQAHSNFKTFAPTIPIRQPAQSKIRMKHVPKIAWTKNSSNHEETANKTIPNIHKILPEAVHIKYNSNKMLLSINIITNKSLPVQIINCHQLAILLYLLAISPSISSPYINESRMLLIKWASTTSLTCLYNMPRKSMIAHCFLSHQSHSQLVS